MAMEACSLRSTQEHINNSQEIARTSTAIDKSKKQLHLKQKLPSPQHAERNNISIASNHVCWINPG